MKIVLAFDSFKGVLTSVEAVEAAKEGVLESYPNAEVVALPLSDGGEGTAETLCRLLDAEWVECDVSDPLMRKIRAGYAISRDGTVAIMDMASAAGLTLLTNHERNPMKTTTYGVGEMILHAKRNGCTHILMGIGGSATNDAGMGMLAALGTRFLDDNGVLLEPIGENLLKISQIDMDGLSDLENLTINAICDVENGLFGEDGAAYVYAAQKGATPDDIVCLDNGLRHLANLCGVDPTIPGSGAAGGLGYGLLMIGANLRRGSDIILDAANLEEHLVNADLVFTGEGKIDRQTLNGKLPYAVMRCAKAHNIPTIALAGVVEDEELLLAAGFAAVKSINPPDLPLSLAMQKETAQQNLTNSIYHHNDYLLE